MRLFHTAITISLFFMTSLFSQGQESLVDKLQKLDKDLATNQADISNTTVFSLTSGKFQIYLELRSKQNRLSSELLTNHTTSLHGSACTIIHTENSPRPMLGMYEDSFAFSLTCENATAAGLYILTSERVKQDLVFYFLNRSPDDSELHYWQSLLYRLKL